MLRKELSAVCGCLCLLLSLCLPNTAAHARNWSHDPASLAEDYSIILDMRSANDHVLVFWLNSAMLPKDSTAAAAAELLDRYIFLGVGHAHVAKDGTLSFTPIPTLRATDKDGKPLKLLDDKALPPVALGMRTTLESMFARALGRYGEGITWFAFDSGSVRPCGRGGIRIPIDGDTYSFDTPIPGCK